jgi:response regulator RpfG family c-di-GMP phosphodiesterase
LFDYFETPLKKLQKATKKISNGDYKEKVQIVTTDSFGVLADSFNDMADSLDAKNKKILSIQNSIVTGMATMVESRDNSTGGHIKRTSDCVRIFIEELKKSLDFDFMTPSFCESVIKAAPMHDLGKIAVDDAILRKPGKFTDEEYEIMKSHSAAGAKIVANVLQEVDDLEFKQIAVNVAHYHHEKFDGKGYPCGLKGEEIPFEARIMALADVFDALVSKRCYKDSFSYDKAFQIIEESLGNHFDPILGKAFIACREKLEALYNEIE